MKSNHQVLTSDLYNFRIVPYEQKKRCISSTAFCLLTKMKLAVLQVQFLVMTIYSAQVKILLINK